MAAAAIIATALAAVLGSPAVPAANVTWLNSNTDMNATSAWSAAPTANSGIFYGASTGTNPVLSADLTMSSLKFNDTTSSGWTVSGPYTLALTSGSTGSNVGAIISSNTTGGTNVISANIFLNSPTGTTTYQVASGANLVLSGNISGGTLSHVGSNTYAGALTLSGSNSFSSFMHNNNGTLNLNSAYALGTGGLNVGVGAFLLDNTSGSAVTLQNNNVQAAATTFTFVGTNNLSFGSGTFAAAANSTLAVAGSTLTIGSLDAAATTYTWTKSGAGTLAITGAAGSNFQAGFTLSAGTLQVGNNTALGSGAVVLGAAGTLQAINNDVTLANNFTWSSGATFSGLQSLTLNGNGSIGISAKNLYNNIAAGKTLTFGGNFDVNSSGAGTAVALTLAGSGNTTFTAGTILQTATAAQAITVTNTGTTRFQGVVATGGLFSQTGAGTVVLSGTMNGPSGYTINNASALFNQTSTGVISGAAGFTLTSGNATLAGANTYAGTTTLTAGVLKLNNANALGGGPLAISGGVLGLGTGNSSFTRTIGAGAGQWSWTGGGFAAYGSDATVNVGSLGVSGTVAMAAGTYVFGATTADSTVELVNTLSFNSGGGSARTVTVNNGSAAVDAKFSGPIVNTAAGGFIKAGAGTLELTAANTYVGPTTINAGQLRFSGAGSLSGTTAMVTVNGSDSELKWNSSVALARPITMTQGTLSGTGTISAAGGVTIGTNATLSPGNSPGTQAFTTGLTLASGGNYTWEINNWTGTQGAAWDVLAVSGSPLDITATSGSPFTIALTSLNGSNTAGSVPNFNGGSSKTFTIATAGSLTNFDASKFAINTSAFSLYNTYSGSWSITGTGNALQLNYTVGSSVTNGSYSLAASVGASSIIVGGTSSISSVITNAGTGTADTLNYNNMVATYTGGTSSLTGSGAGLAQSASGTATGSFTTNAAGSYTLTPVGTVTNSTLGGAATPAGVVTASVTVYNHSAAALSLVSGSGQTIITGGTFAPITFSLTNAGSQNAPLEVANLINLTGSTGSSVVTANGNASYTATGLSNTAIGVNSLNVSMQAGDQQSLSGASALTTVAAASTNYSVLSHATSSLLGGGSSTSTVLDLGIWDYSTATWSTGTSSASFSIFNLAGGSGDSLTALLALTGTSFSGNSEFSSNLATYSQIAGGGSQAFSVTFDTSGIASPGTYAKTFTINMADQQNLSGAAATNTLIVTANVVVVPEPDTIIFAGIGIAMAGWSIWKRRRIAQIMQVK